MRGVFIIKKCKICKKPFKTKKYGGNRKYCFDCSPDNLDRSSLTSFIRKRLRLVAIERLGGKCVKCGDSREYVLDFHHVDADEKEDTISALRMKIDVDNFFKEVDKCILLRANSHRELHYLEGY